MTRRFDHDDAQRIARQVDGKLERELGRKHDPAITRALAEVAGQVWSAAEEAHRKVELSEHDRERAAERKRQSVQDELDVRVGRMLHLLSHTVTFPVLERAAELAPAREVIAREWCIQLAEHVLRGREDDADQRVAQLRERGQRVAPVAPDSRSRSRGGMDPVVAFIAGGLILGGD